MILITSSLTLIFFAAFFLSPPPPVYKHSGTETVKVIATFPAGKRFNTSQASVSIEFEDGTTEIISVPTIKNIMKGQVIKLDVLEADGKKPRYRLAQPANQP